jgi:Fur family peroxide stress response transcriptional regulator
MEQQLQGTKRSKQRERIFLTLKRTRQHPTAEWVYEQVREELPRISLGTVYRNLHVLKQQGKIQELDFGEGTRRYDAFTHEHYHFICEECGTVKDLEVPVQADINDRVKNIVAGVVRSHRLDYFGVCSDCLNKV